MKDRKPFIIEAAVGVLLIGCSFLVKVDYYATMVFFTGFGIAGAAVAQLLRAAYWNHPKHREAYEAKKREAHISLVDERKQYLRMKAGHILYQADTWLMLLLAFVLALVRAEAWVIALFWLLFLFQWLAGVVVFRVLEKRM